MTKPFRSPVMASIHETAEGPHAAGVLDNQTMRKFEARRMQKRKFALFRPGSQFDASRMLNWPAGCSLYMNKAARPNGNYGAWRAFEA